MGLLGKIGGIFAKIKGVVLASTATKIATVAVAVAVVGGGTAGLVYADVFTSAEAAVEEASATMKEAATPVWEELFGWNALQEAGKEQGTELGLEFTIKEVSGDSLGFTGMTLPNLGVRMVSRTTPDAATKLELGLRVAETTLLSAEAYADKESVQVTVPKLFDAVLTMNYGRETFKEEFINSYLRELLGLSKEELEKDWNPIPEDYTADKFFKEHAETLLKLADACKTLKDGTEYEKAGKLEIVLQNEPVNCKVYTAAIKEEALTEAKNEVLPMVQDFMKGFYAGMSEAESELFGTYEEFEATYLNYYREVKDVHITTYVHNKRIARQQMSFAIGEDRGELMAAYAQIGNPYENMELSVLVPVPEGEPVAFVYTVATELTEDDLCVDWKLRAEEDEVTVSFDYERLGGDFVLALENGAQSFEFIGAIGELELGKKIGMELDEYTFREGEYIEEQELNAKLYLKILEDEVQPLTGIQKDVLQMSQDDFNALGEEISGNLMWLLFSMMGLFQ